MRKPANGVEKKLRDTLDLLERERAKSWNLTRELQALELQVTKLTQDVGERACDPTADWCPMKAANLRIAELAAEMKRLQAAGSSVFAPLTPECPLPHVERQRLPDDREGKTFKLRIGTEESLCESCGSPMPGSRVSGHLTLNRYADGRVGEMFLSLDRARRGDLAASFGHQLAIAISIGLQFGVPLEAFAARMRHVRDESGGISMREVDGKLVPCENPRTVGSLVDLLAVVMERFALQGG